MKKYLNNKFFLLLLILPFFNPTAFKFIPDTVTVYKFIQYWKLLAIFVIAFIYLTNFKISKIIFFIGIFEFIAILASVLNGVHSIQPYTNALLAVGISMLTEMAIKVSFNSYRKVYFSVSLIFVVVNLILCIIYPEGLPMATLYTIKANPLYFIGIDNGLIKALIPLLVFGFYPCCEVSYSNRIRKTDFWIYLFCCIISLATVIIVGSATGIFVCALFVGFSIYFMCRPVKKFPLNTMSVLIALFMLFIVILGNNFKIVETILNFFGRSGTFTGRATLWDIAIKEIIEKPILGYGYTAGNIEIWDGYFSSHNLFLELAIHGGLLLLIAFLYLTAISLKKLKKASTPYFGIISLGLICYLLVGLMEAGINEFYFVLLVMSFNSVSCAKYGEVVSDNKINRCYAGI